MSAVYDDGKVVCIRWCGSQRQTLTHGDPVAVVRARGRLDTVPTPQSGRLRKTMTETPCDGNPLTTIV